MNKKYNNVFVISGPSGVGKGSLIKGVLKENTQFKLAISATTREKRVGEVNGKDYYFINEDQFKQQIKNNNFIEFCEVHGNYYGTLKSELKSNDLNQKIIIEIDTQGVEKIKPFLPATYIFIGPCTKNDLKKRLEIRDTDHPGIISQRLENSKKELKKMNNYDYVLINKKLNDSISILSKLLRES